MVKRRKTVNIGRLNRLVEPRPQTRLPTNSNGNGNIFK